MLLLQSPLNALVIRRMTKDLIHWADSHWVKASSMCTLQVNDASTTEIPLTYQEHKGTIANLYESTLSDVQPL